MGEDAQRSGGTSPVDLDEISAADRRAAEERHAAAVRRATGTTPLTTTAGLPPVLLEQAGSRVRLIGLLMAGAYIVALLIKIFFDLIGWHDHTDDNFGLTPYMILACLAMWAVARYGRLAPQTLLDVALFFEVGVGLAIAFVEIERFQLVAVGDRIGVSWVCVWLTLFPLIVPNTRGKMLLAALATASMGPIAYMIRVIGGTAPPTLEVLVHLYLANYITAGLAMVPAFYIYRLGVDVSKAREMGSYRLVEMLGKGGMGEVWRAEHRMLARPGAIKLVRPEALAGTVRGGGERAIQRFEREAQTTSTLRSPHTVELYDFGATEDGTFYYVMELLEGVDLASLVERHGPVAAERAVYILVQVCHSLAEAHERRLIHRDIKPANIYVCRYGLEYDFTKVLDFGLVKGSQQTDPEGARLTVEGATAGTPAFLPPEMATGKDDIDERADLYALGCVGYWLLTGQLVFESDSQVQMVIDHMQTTPIPPSERTENPIPPALDRVIMACLEKEPRRRPQTATELAAALEAIDELRPWTQERAARWWQTHLPRAGAGPTGPGAAATTAPAGGSPGDTTAEAMASAPSESGVETADADPRHVAARMTTDPAAPRTAGDGHDTRDEAR